VESQSPIVLILLFSIGLALADWFLLSHFQALLREKEETQSLLFKHQQIDQLRVQLSQTLDNNTQLVQQQGNAQSRLSKCSEAFGALRPENSFLSRRTASSSKAFVRLQDR
jgi:hypothetical protein